MGQRAAGGLSDRQGNDASRWRYAPSISDRFIRKIKATRLVNTANIWRGDRRKIDARASSLPLYRCARLAARCCFGPERHFPRFRIQSGLRGDRRQRQGGRRSEIGQQMVAARARFPFNMVIMLGDNIYGRQDPQDFVAKFEQPYAGSWGVRFRASLESRQ
jgi:hypothetical protein